MNSKINLGILFGSRSTEHEVSIISALQLAQKANPFKYNVIPIYISKSGAWYTGGKLFLLQTYQNFDPRKSGLTRVYPDLTARSRCLLAFRRQGLFQGEQRYATHRLDCIIPVFHGINGEDGSIQGLLELMDLPYAGTGIAGSAIGMDKIMMKAFFRGNGFPVLPDTWLSRSQFEQDQEAACLHIEGRLSYPLFVKPANLGSSIGVSRAADRQQLKDALALAFTLDRRVLLEQGLDDPIEVNCAVLGYDQHIQASVVEQPIRSDKDLLDFADKYGGNAELSGMAALGRIIPAPISQEDTEKVQALALGIFRSLDCKGVVRVDFMLDRLSGGLYITEVNTIPGSLAFYLWAKTGEGMDYTRLIDRMVESAFAAQAQKDQNTTSFHSDIIKGAINRLNQGSKGAKV